MNLYCLLPDLSYKTDHFVIDDPNKPAHQEVIDFARVLIIEEDTKETSGFYLWRYNLEGKFMGDTWHPDLQQAKKQAEFEFPDIIEGWKEIPHHTKDPLQYVLDLQKQK